MAATWTLLGKRSIKSTQAATEAAPSLPAEGMDLTGVGAVTFRLEADVGQTINADVGQVDIYTYDEGGWAEAPGISIQVPAGSSGARRVTLHTAIIDNPRGRLAPIANGVSVSAGGVTIYALATSASPGWNWTGQEPI